MRPRVFVLTAALLWPVSAGVVATFGAKPCRR
jgi:hypothetical protein